MTKDPKETPAARQITSIENEFSASIRASTPDGTKAIYACFDRNKKKDSLLEWFFRGFAGRVVADAPAYLPLPKFKAQI